MRKLASICVIDTVDNIDNSDFLDVVTLKGKLWKCVVKRECFKSGDKVVYFEIDSALPTDDARFEFLRSRCLRKIEKFGITAKECYRIKTQKLRGVISQGLVLSVDEFPELSDDLSEGRDVTDILRVELYDDWYVPAQGGYCVLQGDQAGKFPHWLQKSDEERIQNMAELFRYDDSFKDIEFEVTEKYDGASATFFYAPENLRINSRGYKMPQFGVCSRNWELKETEGNIYWIIARRLCIEEKLKWYYNEYGRYIAIQGEIVGPNVNHNRDKYNDLDFYVYRIFSDGFNKIFHPNMCRIITEELGLIHVKIINPAMKVFKELPNIDSMLKFVEGKTDHGNEREGMVFKSFDGTLHFKCINNKYLLKEEG